jgi:hypothetical protein
MVLTGQKPTQRKRIGELSEGLPGSTKSVASRRTSGRCVLRETHKNPSTSSGQAWETRVFLREQVGGTKRQVGKPETIGSQISPHRTCGGCRCSALRRESRSHTVPAVLCRCGEGTDRNTQFAKENTTVHVGTECKRANLTASHSEEGKRKTRIPVS